MWGGGGGSAESQLLLWQTSYILCAFPHNSKFMARGSSPSPCAYKNNSCCRSQHHNVLLFVFLTFSAFLRLCHTHKYAQLVKRGFAYCMSYYYTCTQLYRPEELFMLGSLALYMHRTMSISVTHALGEVFTCSVLPDGPLGFKRAHVAYL